MKIHLIPNWAIKLDAIKKIMRSLTRGEILAMRWWSLIWGSWMKSFQSTIC